MKNKMNKLMIKLVIMWKQFKRILNGDRPVIDVLHYLVGNYRYKLYYHDRESTKHWLMRQHIWEQIRFRIKAMNRDCYEYGSCIKCGCETTQLQMCNKSCDGNCYPKMMGKKRWNIYKKINYVIQYKVPRPRKGKSWDGT